MELRQLYSKYRCEKYAHGDEFENIFSSLKDGCNILEVGIGPCALAHREYFSNTGLYFLDNWSDVDPRSQMVQSLLVLGDPRGNSVYIKNIDSTCVNEEHFADQWTAENYNVYANGQLAFDVIIDDGSKKPQDQMNTFLNLVQYLKRPGTYICQGVTEDPELLEFFSDFNYRRNEDLLIIDF